MFRTAAETLIEAPPAAARAVIVDLDRYPEWNRFTPRITLRSDEVRVGTELDLDCRMTPRTLLRDEPEVILAVDGVQSVRRRSTQLSSRLPTTGPRGWWSRCGCCPRPRA